MLFRSLNGRRAHDFETQYDHNFPARNFGISLWAAIDYGLLHEAKSGVVACNDGWLYTDEEFIVDEQSDQLVTQNLARIVAVRDRLAAQQVKQIGRASCRERVCQYV